MSEESIWRVQAHWSVGIEARSYAPVFATSEAEAIAAANEIIATLAHFPTLEVRVELVDRSAAEAEIARADERLDRMKNPMLHLFNDARTGTVCGVAIDKANAALAADLLALAHGEKCSQCRSATSGF